MKRKKYEIIVVICWGHEWLKLFLEWCLSHDNDAFNIIPIVKSHTKLNYSCDGQATQTKIMGILQTELFLVKI